MIDECELRRRACDLVALEALALDEKAWSYWLDLYLDDAVFWVPAWFVEPADTERAARELSFMHLEGRARLAERVERLRSRGFACATPLPRTTHLVAGIAPVAIDERGAVRVEASWGTHVFDPKDDSSIFYSGRYEHELRWDGERLRIKRKKVILASDRLVSKLDFFYV